MNKFIFFIICFFSLNVLAEDYSQLIYSINQKANYLSSNSDHCIRYVDEKQKSDFTRNENALQQYYSACKAEFISPINELLSLVRQSCNSVPSVGSVDIPKNRGEVSRIGNINGCSIGVERAWLPVTTRYSTFPFVIGPVMP